MRIQLAAGERVAGEHLEVGGNVGLHAFDGEALELCVPPAAKHLAEKNFQDKLRGALQERFGKPVRLTVTIRETTGNSARDRAAAAVTRDAFVRDLVENFDATIVESSIKPTQ